MTNIGSYYPLLYRASEWGGAVGGERVAPYSGFVTMFCLSCSGSPGCCPSGSDRACDKPAKQYQPSLQLSKAIHSTVTLSG